MAELARVRIGPALMALTRTDAYILVGVVVVDMGITNGMDIEIKAQPDIGFARDPVNLTLPFHNP